MPLHLAGCQIDGKYRIGVIVRGLGIAVAGGEVIELRFLSMVGLLHNPAPDGANCGTPNEFLNCSTAGEGIVYVFQISFPVAASSATKEPRKCV